MELIHSLSYFSDFVFAPTIIHFTSTSNDPINMGFNQGRKSEFFFFLVSDQKNGNFLATEWKIQSVSVNSDFFRSDFEPWVKLRVYPRVNRYTNGSFVQGTYMFGRR